MTTPFSLPRKRLEEAEAIDGYLSAIQASELNRLARRTSQYKPYYASPDLVESLLKKVDEIQLLAGADIIIMHPSADNGYPHTRPGSIVCLPLPYLERQHLSETLRHEAVHLHQRKRPELWDSACKREGWTPVPSEVIPLQLRNQVRINPDTMQCPFWSWQGSYAPLPLFVPKPAAGSNLSLADCVVKWLDVRNGSIHRDPPPSFAHRYGQQPAQPEHPYELLAVEYAANAIADSYTLESKLMT